MNKPYSSIAWLSISRSINKLPLVPLGGLINCQIMINY